MNNKIPPPIVALAVALLILLTNRLFGFLQWQVDGLKLLALAFVLAGLAIELYSVLLFIKARTTVNPLKPENSKALVVGGLYRFSRNPMYLGMLLLLCGLVAWLGNIATAPLVALFILYINRFQIMPEEQALETLFGAEYQSYKQRVRRWL